MFQGLRTVIYHVEDLEKAKEWYSKALKIKPYFDKPFYVGFNVGGYELGLDPDMAGVKQGNAGVAYWGVPDAKAAFNKLLELGANPTARCRRWEMTSASPPSPTPSATSSVSSKTLISP